MGSSSVLAPCCFFTACAPTLQYWRPPHVCAFTATHTQTDTHDAVYLDGDVGEGGKVGPAQRQRPQVVHVELVVPWLFIINK
jgi:hypothetical protein